MAVFEQGRLPGMTLRHEVRPDLLAAAEAACGLTPEIEDATWAALEALRRDSQAVLLTCSTLGPAVGRVGRPGPPVLRTDAALAQLAVKGGGRVRVLCAAPTTIGPTRALFEQAAEATGATVELSMVPGAWDAFRRGDAERYYALIAAAADGAWSGAEAVALAQASMAPAASQTRGPAPLTSPAAGLRAALDASNTVDPPTGVAVPPMR